MMKNKPALYRFVLGQREFAALVRGETVTLDGRWDRKIEIHLADIGWAHMLNAIKEAQNEDRLIG